MVPLPAVGEESGGESHQLACSSESDGEMLTRPVKGKKPAPPLMLAGEW